MWVHFWDMHSGGKTKLPPYEKIYIEASGEEEAINIFCNRFGRHPYTITCSCCGQDYAISRGESLEDITGFHRHCDYDKETDKYVERPDEWHDSVISLKDYCSRRDVLVIRKEDIKLEEREPNHIEVGGWVWLG